MLNAFTVRWLEHDETKIKYTDAFKAENWILKADILQDAIALLEEKYNHVLKVEQIEWYKKMKGVKNATKRIN